MRLQIRFSKANANQNSGFLCNMVLEWREREHGDVEEAMQGDLMAQQELRVCGLYKFWCLGNLRVVVAFHTPGSRGRNIQATRCVLGGNS